MVTRKKIKEINPEAVLWDGLDDAIIGISSDGKVVYDIHMLESVVWRNHKTHISFDEARDWVAYNILSTYVGDFTPIHVYALNDEEE